MPNWCSNKVVVTGPVEEIARFTQTCIRPKDGTLSFDFNSLIPMPAILKDTMVTLDDVILGMEVAKEKIALEERRSIEAFVPKARQQI